MQFMRSYFRFNVFFVLLYAVSTCFAGCNGNGKEENKPGNNKATAKANVTDLFLSYTDSAAKLPLDRFNEAGITSLNKTFAGKLPLTIYDGKEHRDDKSIVIQPYKNNDIATISAGMILLVPKSITESLRIGDFTRHFGEIKKEKPLIGITEQPLPVEISIDAHTSLKLTFNNNEKLDQAHVTMVEILKYR
ncbi:hypothetical protein GCM10007422_43660 [Pedobacter zeae]|uniref:Lipoprotein n=2 Tax=Pedobacter zeae TaxID=1737356 RepID=A0A7W6KFE0_9SPHI|nr:hypothetical protein [Pedobacter zeae]MBB4110637.1 hypothetical protein [Pedobacter zeae]GGH19066.1 hypothetical protein GCM10007422_43660 [Pedobacter zeae]